MRGERAQLVFAERGLDGGKYLVFFQARAPGICGQEDLFFLAEMSPPLAFPETHKVTGAGASRKPPPKAAVSSRVQSLLLLK